MKYVVVQLQMAGPNEAAHPGVLGFGILNLESMQFVGTNTYDLLPPALERCQALEEAGIIKTNWPDARDPDVMALLSDPEFGNEFKDAFKYTVEDGLVEVTNISSTEFRRIHKACEIVARSRAGIK